MVAENKVSDDDDSDDEDDLRAKKRASGGRDAVRNVRFVGGNSQRRSPQRPHFVPPPPAPGQRVEMSRRPVRAHQSRMV